jgi:hypothetical protein
MKKHLSILASLGMALFVLAGCRKLDEPTPLPKCIEEKLAEFKSQGNMPTANVAIYTYQGTYVYVFDAGTEVVDGASEIVDGSCKTLGYLGGFAGNCMINGGNFCKDSKFVEEIWHI